MGHILLSGEYSKNNGVIKEDRPWFDTQVITGAGTAANPYRWFSGVRANTSTFGGLIRRTATVNATLPNSLANMMFNPDGTLSPFNRGGATNTATLSAGGDGIYAYRTNMIVGFKRAQGFGRFDYDLTDNVHAFAQVNYSTSQGRRALWINGFADTSDNALVIYSGNPFLRPEIQALLTANGIASFTLSETQVVAIGAEYRRQSLVQVSSNRPTDRPDFTGVRGGYNGRTLPFNSVLTGSTRGNNSVWEVNGEIVAPLLRNSPLGRSLEISGTVRYTKYSISGAATTWKAGFDYAPVDGFRIRGTTSRDIRAPTLYELFAPNEVRSFNLNDPLTSTQRETVQTQRGNPGLVTQIRACTASGGTSPLCANIVRPINNTNTTSANFPTGYTLAPINAATNHTRGVDMQVGYRTSLDAIRPDSAFEVRVMASYQPKLEIQAYSAAAMLNYAGVGDRFSKWRVNTQVDLKLGDFSVNLLNRFRGAIRWNADANVVYYDKPAGAYNITDISFTQAIPTGKGEVETYLAVANIFNRAPRIFPNTTTGQIAPVVTGDDVMGRTFTIGARFKF